MKTSDDKKHLHVLSRIILNLTSDVDILVKGGFQKMEM